MMVKKAFKKVVSVTLSLAMVIGILPITALAAPADITKFKSMRMSTFDGTQVAAFDYYSATNTRYNAVNMNDGMTWAKLSYTVEYTQPVSLILYKMNADYEGENPIQLDYDPDDADANEDFLDGEMIGYIYGVPVTDNIDTSGDTPTGKELSTDEWNMLYWRAVNWAQENITEKFASIHDVEAYGFSGDTLAEGTGAALTTNAVLEDTESEIDTTEDASDSAMEDSENTDEEATSVPEATTEVSDDADAEPGVEETAAPTEEAGAQTDTQDETSDAEVTAPEEEPDTQTQEESGAQAQEEAGAAAVAMMPQRLLAATPVSFDLAELEEVIEEPEAVTQSEGPTDSEESDEPETVDASTTVEISDTAEDAAQAEETAAVSETEATANPYTEADVLIDRNMASPAFSALSVDDSVPDNIINYVLWNGKLTNEAGELIDYTYEDGCYVIVMKPSTPGADIYNSFLAFENDTDLQARFTDSAFWHELEEMADELGWTVDSVNLLTGSFRWEYEDMSLYGKNDLPFIRYYESSDGSRSHHLGLGWSSNYSYELDVQPLFAHVTLPGGKDGYFELGLDGSYSTKGDYAFYDTGSGYLLVNEYEGTTYRFNADELLSQISYLNGDVVTLTYTDGQVTGISSETGRFTLEYSGEHISRITDSAGRVMTLSYDGDYLMSVENTDGDSLRYTYDSNGYLESVENFKGEVYVENEYDAQGRVIHQYAADIGTFDFTYDPVARHNVCTGTDGYLLDIYYDEMGRITQSTNAAGGVTVVYNEKNEVESETDREGNVTSYAHDDDSNITEINYPDGTSETYSYNDNHQVTRMTDRNGAVTTYDYNSKGSMTGSTDALGGTMTYAYDENNNMISAIDALGAETTYTYDSAGNMTSSTDAQGNSTTLE